MKLFRLKKETITEYRWSFFGILTIPSLQLANNFYNFTRLWGKLFCLTGGSVWCNKLLATRTTTLLFTPVFTLLKTSELFLFLFVTYLYYWITSLWKKLSVTTVMDKFYVFSSFKKKYRDWGIYLKTGFFAQKKLYSYIFILTCEFLMFLFSWLFARISQVTIWFMHTNILVILQTQIASK